MDMSTSAPREIASQGTRAHVEGLLKRYPEVTAAEAAEILHFLKHGPPLEVALLTTEEQLRLRLEQFRADHASDFSLQTRHYLLVAALLGILILGCVLLWDVGVK